MSCTPIFQSNHGQINDDVIVADKKNALARGPVVFMTLDNNYQDMLTNDAVNDEDDDNSHMTTGHSKVWNGLIIIGHTSFI